MKHVIKKKAIRKKNENFYYKEKGNYYENLNIIPVNQEHIKTAKIRLRV